MLFSTLTPEDLPQFYLLTVVLWGCFLATWIERRRHPDRSAGVGYLVVLSIPILFGVVATRVNLMEGGFPERALVAGILVLVSLFVSALVLVFLFFGRAAKVAAQSPVWERAKKALEQQLPRSEPIDQRLPEGGKGLSERGQELANGLLRQSALALFERGRGFQLAALAATLILFWPLVSMVAPALPGTKTYEWTETQAHLDLFSIDPHDAYTDEFDVPFYTYYRTGHQLNWPLLLSLYGFYLLPCVVAVWKGTSRLPGLFLRNFFFGWTLVVWGFMLFRASRGHYCDVAT